MRQISPPSARLMNLVGAAPELYHDIFFEANPRFGGNIGVPRSLSDIPDGQIAAVKVTIQG